MNLLAQYEKELFEFMESKHSEIWTELEEKKEFDDDLDAKMKAAMEEFNGVFKPQE